MDKNEIINLIKELIEKTNVSVMEISVADNNLMGKEKNVWFQVEIDKPHLYLARGAEGLAALNHIVRRILESKISSTADTEAPEILIDINGFQKKRIEGIHAIAHMMAERARYFKSNIEVEPMSAFERRIVHEFLSNETDLKTESEGAGPTRRVVIKYIGSL